MCRRATRCAWGLAALVVLALGSAPLGAQAVLTDELLTVDGEFDKSPSLDGDWMAWTWEDATFDSRGNVRVMHLPTGAVYDLGSGFHPDVTATGGAPSPDVTAAWQPGPQAPGPGGAPGGLPGGSSSGPGQKPGPVVSEVVRVAYLRLAADGRLDVLSATLDRRGFTTQVLAADVGYADHVRACGDVTVWTAPGPGGSLAVHAHDGTATVVLEQHGQAFRPELARDSDGRVWVVWDLYRGGNGQPFDYEVFLASRTGPGQWSPPQNLSQAPGAADLAPTIAAAPGGRLWIAWQTTRGQIQVRIFVLAREPDGTLLHPQPYPPSVDPADLGLVDLKSIRDSRTPRLAVDGMGRPWLMAAERVTGTDPQLGLYEKQLHYSFYDGDAWWPMQLLSTNPLGEVEPDLDGDGDVVRLAYQKNHLDTSGAPGNPFDLEIALATLDASASATPLLLSPATLAPEPSLPLAAPELPGNRTLQVGGETWRLLFADFHSHTRHSPDGMGELDHALFYARDVAKLDAWACVDHDTGASEPRFDYEYELSRRFVQRFDTSDFAAFMGFEWTNQTPHQGGEIIGHRATFDCPYMVRYNDPQSNTLAEYYAIMLIENAIGVPHHLGKAATGGATFLLFDPIVQPVTEVASIHGIYEDTLIEKLLVNQVRFGVTAAGDDHNARPGVDGLAGIWVADGPLDHDVIKDGLRARRTFAVKPNGAWFDFRIEGAPLGSSIEQAGDLLFEYAFDAVPGSGTMTISLTRNGDYLAPVYQAAVMGGLPADDALVIPGVPEPAFYMLRVTTGTGTGPLQTVLWSTPIWVDPPTP